MRFSPFLWLSLLLTAPLSSTQAGAQSAAALANIDVADMSIAAAREKSIRAAP
ncbi:hypothetical protein ACFP9V_05520 [Deinococcus radiopugnans]|uniref:hypothetical protein n=1 Tax=Deinococcus radiopugnans TaxID=57497 RepID=UPI003617B00A